MKFIIYVIVSCKILNITLIVQTATEFIFNELTLKFYVSLSNIIYEIVIIFIMYLCIYIYLPNGLKEKHF